MTRLVRILTVLVLVCVAACGKDDGPCDASKSGCPGYASPQELDELHRLVDAYMAAPDDAAAEPTLATILAKQAATVAHVRSILAEPPKRDPAPTGIIKDIPFKVGTKASDYSLWVPTTYDPKTPYPLIMCMHGAFFTGAEYIDKWQPRLGEDFILVCPTSDDWWSAPTEAFVFALIDEITRTYNVDPNHIFLSGMSDGGTGAFILGMHHPDRFAGVAPMASGFGLFDFLQNFVDTPVYYIHGSQDQVMPIELGRKIVQKLNEFGVDVTFREHNLVNADAGGGHFFPREELPALLAWFLDRVRDPYPKRLNYLRDGAHLGRLFWSDVSELAPIDTIDWAENDYATRHHTYAHFEAKIEGNRIDVTTTSIKAYRLLLSDELLDLSRPVEIFTNGVQSFQGTLERSTDTLLREARARRDRAMLFSAAVSVKVP